VSTFVAGDEASVSTSTGGDGLNVALLTVLLLAVGAAGAAFGFVARGLEAR